MVGCVTSGGQLVCSIAIVGFSLGRFVEAKCPSVIAIQDEKSLLVLEQVFVQRNLEGLTIKKFIVVPGRIINIVVG